MKVVWLCHFVNSVMKDYFHTPHVQEMAPWINNLIVLFQERNDIELHIVAPNVFTNKQQKVKIKNVEYHFYQRTPTFIPQKLNRKYLESRTNFYFIKKKINRIIERINPDLVHLHGAENPYYSAGILPIIDRYPTLVTIQGFVRNATANDSITNKRIKIEEEILKRTNHIGICTKEMSQISLSLNPHTKLHFHDYPFTIPNHTKECDTESSFDILFFARICKDKGIEDLLEAVALLKKEKPEITLHVIGQANKYYLEYLENLSKLLNIEDNVKFLGFLESQQDIYKHAINAKVCVLPTYHEAIAGTIIESMFMKLPVIAYAVGGIPELNDKGQILVLVEKNNIQQLAIEIAALLKNKNKRNELAENAYFYAHERFKNSNVIHEIMRAYEEVLYK